MTKEKFGDSGSRDYEVESRNTILVRDLREKPFLSFRGVGFDRADNPLKSHKMAKGIVGVSTKLLNQKCGGGAKSAY